MDVSAAGCRQQVLSGAHSPDAVVAGRVLTSFEGPAEGSRQYNMITWVIG